MYCFIEITKIFHISSGVSDALLKLNVTDGFKTLQDKTSLKRRSNCSIGCSTYLFLWCFFPERKTARPEDEYILFKANRLTILKTLLLFTATDICHEKKVSL